MQHIRWQTGIWLILVFCLGPNALAQQKQQQTNDEDKQPYPSEQMLEFLADFGDIDEQTYELIEYHALQRDRKPDPQESPDDE